MLADVSNGAESLGELDFARACRRYGLPTPSRQVWRRLPTGRFCLDVYWDQYGVVVESEGIHHAEPGAAIDDSLRQNALTITHDAVLRIAVLGLRTNEADFMRQVEELLGRHGYRAA